MRERILDELSIEMVWEHIMKLTEIAPQRLSGTEEEKKVARYIKECFDSYGIDMTIHELDAYVSFPGESELMVLEPEKRVIQSQTLAQTKSTPPEGVEGDLVYVGVGGLDAYEDVDVRGKITLAELSYSPPRPEKVRLTTEHGAIAQIQMNWGLPEHDSLPMGTVKAIWGNPTPETFPKMPRIPVVGIKRRDGEWLIEKLKNHRVRVRLKAHAENRWGKILEPIARIQGQGEPEKFVIVGGHYDAWGGGATCNATGNATILELARVFSKHRECLRRSLLFTFWPGHETGIMEGSTWFADTFWDDLNENGILYINIDSPGLKDAVGFIATASPEAYRFHAGLVREVLKYKAVEERRLARTGDQSFFGIGIPSIYGRHHHSQEDIEKWHGATLGWWYHSQKDTVDKIDTELLKESLKMHACYAYELATRPRLPFEFVSVAEVMVNRLRALKTCGVKFALDSLIDAANELRDKAQELDERGSQLEASADANPDELAMFNEILMRLSRILTSSLGTVSGRWSQDTYGLTALRTPLPGLFPLERMSKLGGEDGEYKLLWTQLLRERNRCMDALKEARRAIDTYLH